MPPLIFARVQPKSIKIAEKYGYTADIASNLLVDKKQKATAPTAETSTPSVEVEGSVKVEIPYDGEKFLTAQATGDVERQEPGLWRGQAAASTKKQPPPSDTKAQIGFLGFLNHGKTDLKKNYKLGYHDVVPLEVVVKTGQSTPATDAATPTLVLQSKADLQENRFGTQITYTYAPEPLKLTPVHPIFRIYDEDIQDELDEDEWEALDLKNVPKNDSKAQKRHEKKIEHVLQMLKQQETFQYQLVFELRWELYLAGPAGRGNDDNPPKIERIAIHWPAPISQRRLKLQIDGKENHTILYDPEKQVIEWRDIKFKAPKDKAPGKDYFVYESPTMLLSVTQPMELYQLALGQNQTRAAQHEALTNVRLPGEMGIKIAHALSGLQVEHFNATGQKSDIKVEAQTNLAVDFSFDLDDLFNHKAILPYQHLEFEGVPFTDSQLEQLKQILRDLGFAVRALQLGTPQSNAVQYIVAGWRQSALENLWLWMLITGQTVSRHRPASALSLEQLLTPVSAPQQSTIYMRGRLMKGNTNLIELMNEIQRQMRQKFQPLTAIEE